MEPKYCIDCHKPITINATRCGSCSQKGKIGPLLGRKGKLHPAFGLKRSKRTKRLLAESKWGERNHQWKGDKVSISSLHQWIKRHKPKSKVCERCKIVPPCDLANISQKYHRDVNDFEWLCRRCHMKGDGRIERMLEACHRKNPKRGLHTKCSNCGIGIYRMKSKVRKVNCCSYTCAMIQRHKKGRKNVSVLQE